MSALPALLAGSSTALATALCFRARPLTDRMAQESSRALSHGGAREPGAPLRRLRPALAMLVVLAGWALLGGFAGLFAGGAGAAVAWVVLGRAEPPGSRMRRERLEQDLPTAVDLIATVLVAGSSIDRSLAVVARAVGGPVAEELMAISHQLDLGVDPTVVWGAVAIHPQLGPFGRAALRAHESGASVAVAVRRLGEELRARARADVEARARTVEVKAAAPLGVCFLPAFVLLGVAPMVAGVFTSLNPFG